MKGWFKRKAKFSHVNRGISDNFDTPTPMEVKQQQSSASSVVVSRGLTNSYGYDSGDCSHASSDEPAIAYPAYQLQQGLGDQQNDSFKVNAGKNVNKKGTQKNGGVNIVTTSGSDSIYQYKEVDFDVGHNLNEGDHQVNDNIYYNDGGEASERR